MSLPNPATGDTIQATDVSDIKNHLEGGSGKTAPYNLRQSTGNMLLTAATNDGSNGIRFNDSDNSQIFYVDSDGNITVVGTITNSGALVLPVSASPSQTADGSVVWDSDDDVLTVGDGAARKTFYPGIKSLVWVAGDSTERTTQSATIVDLSTLTVSIPTTSWTLIRGAYRKTTGHASTVYLGLKINATEMLATTGVAVASTNNAAESGFFEFTIPPQVTGYLQATTLSAYAGAAAGLSTVQYIGKADTDAPAATITTLIVRGLVGNALNTLAIDEVNVYTIGNGS